MDATSANIVLDATARIIVSTLWTEVKEGAWKMAVERMENAMLSARAVIQHADIIPGIVIAVEQLLHHPNTPWPHWTGMTQWTHKSVGHHPWAHRGSVVHTPYEVGTITTHQEQLVQPPEEVSGVDEDRRGAQILHIKMEEGEEDVSYLSRRKELGKGKKMADKTDAETPFGKRKADGALEEESDRGKPRIRRSYARMTIKKIKPIPRLKHMTKAQRAEHRRELKEYRERRMEEERETEEGICDTLAGSSMPRIASPIASTTTALIPVPEYTHAPPVPTHAPISAKRKPGRPKGRQKPPVPGQPAHACSTCVEFGVLCVPNPGFSCGTCRSRKKKCEQAGQRRGRSASRAHQLMQSETSDTCSQGRFTSSFTCTKSPTQSRATSEAPGEKLRRSSRPSSSKWATSVKTITSAAGQGHPVAAFRRKGEDNPSMPSSQGLRIRIPLSRVRAETSISNGIDMSGSSNALKLTNHMSAPPASAEKTSVDKGLTSGPPTYALSRSPIVSHQEHQAISRRLETIAAENCELQVLVKQALSRVEVLEQGMASLVLSFGEQEHSKLDSRHYLHPAKPSHPALLPPPLNPIIITFNPDPETISRGQKRMPRDIMSIPPDFASMTSPNISFAPNSVHPIEVLAELQSGSDNVWSADTT